MATSNDVVKGVFTSEEIKMLDKGLATLALSLQRSVNKLGKDDAIGKLYDEQYARCVALQMKLKTKELF